MRELADEYLLLSESSYEGWGFWFIEEKVGSRSFTVPSIARPWWLEYCTSP